MMLKFKIVKIIGEVGSVNHPNIVGIVVMPFQWLHLNSFENFPA